jgi:hypothetical protein
MLTQSLKQKLPLCSGTRTHVYKHVLYGPAYLHTIKPYVPAVTSCLHALKYTISKTDSQSTYECLHGHTNGVHMLTRTRYTFMQCEYTS